MKKRFGKLTLKVRLLQFLKTELNARQKNFLLGYFLSLSIKDGPVKCAKVRDKNGVILMTFLNIYSSFFSEQK